MDKVKLKSEKRDIFGRKVSRLRKQGKVPAVIYGKGVKTEPILIDLLDLSRLLKKSGEISIIEIEDSENKKKNVIINEIQKDPISGNIIHVDFYRVRMDEKIQKEVPLEFVGESPAVKEAGGILIRSIDEIAVTCLPADLPSEITVDISVLKTFEDKITVSDLILPKAITIEIDPETVVASVAPPRSQEEVDSLQEKVEEDVSQVKVVEKEAEEKAEESEAAEK